MKMSFVGAEEGKEEEVEVVIEEETVKLIEIPVIELTDFREKVLAVTRVAVRNILDSVRSNKDNIKIDTILPLIKIALVG